MLYPYAPLASRILCIISCLFVSAGSSLLAADLEVREETRSLAVGLRDIIDLDFEPGAVEMGDPSLVKVEPGQSRQIKVTALKKGITNILVQDNENRVRRNIKYNFSQTDKSQILLALREILHDVEGIEIKMIGDRVIIDGELIVPRDFDRIIAAQQVFPEVINLVTLSVVSQVRIARTIQDEIQRQPGGINVTVRLANETYFLEGTVDSLADKDRAQLIAQTYLPEKMVFTAAEGDKNILKTVDRVPLRNLITVNAGPPAPPKKMIRLTYHFVEMGKEFLKSSLFKWTPLLSEGSGLVLGESSTGGIGATTGGSFVGTITNLFPTIQSGSNGGFARVLFSNVTIGLDGDRQQFQREEQIPFISQVAEGGTPVTDFIPVGLRVTTDPAIAGNDLIEMGIDFEFKSAAGAGAGGTPRVNTTNVKNRITVKSGDSAVLGGLISNNLAKDINKDPEEAGGEQTGSPLFKLLRAKAFRNQKTQFLVFITPKIIEDAATGTADIKAKIIGSRGQKRKEVQKPQAF